MIVVPVGKTKFAGTPVREIDTEPELQVPPVSVAVAIPSSSSRVAVHEDVVTDTLGGTVSVGGVVSAPAPACTVTVCEHEATLPLVLSVAVQVITVVPTGNGSLRGRPSLRTAATTTLPSDGFVVGVPIVAAETVASQVPSGAVTVTFAGHEIVTGGRSPEATIVIVWLQLAVRPPASVTVHRMPVAPIGYGSVSAWTTAGVTTLPLSS